MAEKVARQIMSFDPVGMDGMTLAELTDIVEHELRDRDGLAYYVNVFDSMGNTALSDELIEKYYKA